ncbi:MAG: CinA family protein [Proteobacteria bacterium]|nr:CinA family protein [Pseudomonadota bacterium]NOG60306.1 CinA family protein [Pseudomonadota bacterium]
MSDIASQQAEQLAELFLKSSAKLVTAESCTGGGLAEILTRIPGSSAWFERGYVTYSNESKNELLNVPVNTLEQYGAVSEETAIAMVEGALENSHANYSVSITGIAGPDGGTEDKPVGTVCFGWSKRNGVERTTHIVFEGDRLKIREQACMLAMQGLIDLLQKDID